MFLTLENAELVDEGCIWRFPKMKYTACIKSITIPETLITIPETVFSFNLTIKDNCFIEKVLDITKPFEPLPAEFEGDLFRVKFIRYDMGPTYILPSEVTFELTEI